MAYQRIETFDNITRMNTALYDNLQDGIDEALNGIKCADKVMSQTAKHNTDQDRQISFLYEALQTDIMLEEFSQENPLVAQYLENVQYDSNDYTVSNVAGYANQIVSYRKDQPVSYKGNLNQSGLLALRDGGSGKTNYIESPVGGIEVCNTIPNKISYWWNMIDNAIVQTGAIKPTGNLRMIKIGDIKNVRDFGGWHCDGGTVKYGRLFRGGTFHDETQGVNVSITDTDKQMCRDLLGIKHELDLRTTGETVGQIGSALGEDILYTNIQIGGITSNYAVLVDLNGQYVNEIKEILLTIFNSIKSDQPTYIHCTFGADRTGAVSFIINGLLGVSQNDLDKDYELTSFYSLRKRTEPMYRGLIDYFNTFGGVIMKDNIVRWAHQLGISLNEINEFRRNMINGDPNDVSLDATYECIGISLSETSGSIKEGDQVNLVATLNPTYTTDKVVWTSNNNIVNIISDGVNATIVGVSEGTAIITATCGNYSATYSITVKSLLPDGYEPVAYIDQAVDTTDISKVAYCDLGITGRTGLIFKGKAFPYTYGDKYLFGSTNASSERLILGSNSYIGTISEAGVGICAGHVGMETTFEFSTVVGDSYMYNYMPEHSTPESKVILTTNSTEFDNGVTMGLFCRNNKGTYQRPFSCKLYYLIIEEDGEEIMHLLPCKRTADNIVGLYDIIGERFLTSLNESVAFVAGE